MVAASPKLGTMMAISSAGGTQRSTAEGANQRHARSPSRFAHGSVLRAAVCKSTSRNRGKASGVETETPLALVTEIRDGKTISIRGYLDREEALEAAGLSE